MNTANALGDVSAPTLNEGASLLDQVVEQSKIAKSESEHLRARDLIA